MNFCINCGGELNPGDYKSAVKCEHCGSYVIFEERTSGEYEPRLIIPFKIGKKQAQELVKKEFGKKPFLPSDFLSEGKMDKMEGLYVPYFLFDFDCDYQFRGTGHVVRTWRSGDTEYTETSVFRVERDMNVGFEKVPVDASIAMADDIMDLLEPFGYGSAEPFQMKYMSGFLAEKYNMTSEEKKVILNIKKFFMGIDNENYGYSYSVLSEAFKNNNYPTKNDFINYAKANFFKQNEVEYVSYKKQNDLYIYEIKLKDATGNNKEEKMFNIILKLNSGTDFEMSFGQ